VSLGLQSFILLGGLFFLLAFGIEIGPAMGIVAGVGLLFFVHQPLDYFTRAAFEIMNSFTLTAIPLFIFMGPCIPPLELCEPSSLAERKFWGICPGA